jgi:hypothetical protein
MHRKSSGNALMGTGHVAFTAPRPLHHASKDKNSVRTGICRIVTAQDLK